MIVTEAGYAGGERQVLRACVRATGRDRVIAQADNGLGNGDRADVIGLDRRWVVLRRVGFTRYDPCPYFGLQRPVDARSGRLGRATEARSCTEFPSLAQPGLPTVVTDRGVAAWIVEQDGARRLLAAAPGGGVSELDRGAIDGLRAQGTAVAWSPTDSRAPHRFPDPPGGWYAPQRSWCTSASPFFFSSPLGGNSAWRPRSRKPS